MIAADRRVDAGPSQGILIVSPYSPLTVGGVGQFMIDVGALLVREGVPVGFLYLEGPRQIELPAPLRSSARFEVSIRGPRGLRIVLEVVRAVKRMLSNRSGFAVCHALVPQPVTAAAVAFARFLGRRSVATIFAPYPKDPNPMADAAQRLAERLTLLLADEIVYECAATRQHFPRKGVIIYNGIDTAYYRPSDEARAALRSRLGIPPDTVVFLYTGRLTELKGIRDLIEAFQGLDPSVIEKALLLLVGPIETKHREAVFPPVLAYPDRVRHIPPVGKYEIRDYYQASDVFVLPSYWEGISSSLVEAMACGLPALVSDAGGSPEVVAHGRNGYVHVPGDVAAIRARLKELIENADVRRAMGRAARLRTEEEFDLHGMTRRYRDVYADVLGRDGSTVRPSQPLGAPR